MTLGGLFLAIGPLVDNAIVVLENTHRHLGMGKTPFQAAADAAERTHAARAGRDALALIIVLCPVALTPGVGGFLFKPLADGRGVRHARLVRPGVDLRAGPVLEDVEGPRCRDTRRAGRAEADLPHRAGLLMHRQRSMNPAMRRNRSTRPGPALPARSTAARIQLALTALLTAMRPPSGP